VIFRTSYSALIGACIFVCLAVLCCAAPAALAGPTVTVRIEGEAATLLPAATVTLSGPEPVSNCSADSVAAAINLAVGGNWDHGEASGGGGDFTQTILGETHAFTHESDTWAEWVDYRWGGGICTDLLQEGDEVLMVADHEPEPFFAPTVLPLVVSEVPASVQVGVPFTVKVSAVHTPLGAFPEPGEGAPEAIAGAIVSGGGASGTTNPGGIATLTLTSTGTATLRATRAGDAPSRTLAVCAHNGNDGNCGTSGTSGTSADGTRTASAGSSTGAGGVAGFNTQGTSTSYRGPYALVASVAGIIDGHVYAHGHGPRLLSGRMLAHNAVSSVSLSLRRSYRNRCYSYNGTSARFAPARCGTATPFSVSTAAAFSYLLPEALKPGRYVLDVKGSDAAGNHTTLARGSTRIVFYVR
jgi:hypothetical protein